MTRWQKATLAASLVLNLVLIGLLAGHFLRAMRHPPMAPLAFGIVHMIDTLPPERRALLQPLVRDSLVALRPQLRAMREAQLGIDRALGAEPFDAEMLARRLAEQRASMNAAQADSHAALIRLTKQLSRDERVRLAAALREPPWMMRGRGGRHFRPPDAPTPP